LPAEAGKTYVVARDWGNPWDALISHGNAINHPSSRIVNHNPL